MKRKTKTGVKLLTQAIERMRPGGGTVKPLKNDGDQTSMSSNSKLVVANDLSAVEGPDTKGQGEEKDYIYPLLYIYRAYGYIVLEDYEKSLKDFTLSAQNKKLNAS